jgi:uncharacterized protein Veg
MDSEERISPITFIHNTLASCEGQCLKVKANLGRSKIAEYEGVVTEAHEQLFVMEIRRKRGKPERKSYQYVDVLTGTVILSYEEAGDLLFPEPFEIPV